MEAFVIDLIVIALLGVGTFIGVKKGLIKGIISIFGVILCIIIAWSLKDILAEFMFTKLPFVNFNDNMALNNIIIYELVAFLIILIVLLIVLRLIMIVTKLIDKILSISKSLGFISRLLGALLGFIESYVLVFIILFILHSTTPLKDSIDKNYISNLMLKNSPLLSNITEKDGESFQEIISLDKNYKKGSDEYNKHLFEIIVKYDVIKYDTAKKLIDDNKLKIDGASDILEKYKK